MNRKSITMAVLALAMATAAMAADANDVRESRGGVQPVSATEVGVAARSATEVGAPVVAEATQSGVHAAKAAPAGEFAGADIVRFFTKTVEAAKDGGATLGVPGTSSMRLAAY